MSNSIITKILGKLDKNIKIDENFLENRIIRGTEYNVLKGVLTYEVDYCPICGCKNEKHSIVKNGSQMVKAFLGTLFDLPAVMMIKKQRFLCKHCNHTFMAKTSITKERCVISNKVKKEINLELSENISMKYISKKYCVSIGTVANILRTNKFTSDRSKLPEVLGIDEFKSTKSVDANMSVILCDINSGDIVDIISDRRKKYLKDYFNSYTKEARNNVKYVTCDMYQPYIDLAKEMFPNAKIVIDKFHIVQLLTRCMQKLRINVMKDFKTTSKEYKKFKRYWKIPLKKSFELNGVEFFKYYHYKKQTNSKGIAKDLTTLSERFATGYSIYQEFLLAVHNRDVDSFKRFIDNYYDNDKVIDEFKVSIKTLYKYKDYIITALETNYTNAVVEGNNNMIKCLKKTACGFRSFNNMRIRIILRKKINIRLRISE